VVARAALIAHRSPLSVGAGILAGMAYDEELAARIRAALSFTDQVTERRMFGGLGFMVAGHMVAAAAGGGGMMLRVDPALGSELVDGDGVRPFRMNGRDLSGWLYLQPAAVDDETALRTWLERGLAFVATLPPK
jgi:TfoX/Sxy family transcriptional regulator of competence genes